jgi:hypothetical protein
VERRLATVTGEENTLVPMPRGNWLCVGPFNFPLAIVGRGLHSSNSQLSLSAFRGIRGALRAYLEGD